MEGCALDHEHIDHQPKLSENHQKIEEIIQYVHAQIRNFKKLEFFLKQYVESMEEPKKIA